MELRKVAKISLMTVSSMGVRMTPLKRQAVHSSKFFEMESTSAETNVLNVSAALGLSTKVLTKFVDDSPIAHFIRTELRARNIAYESKDVTQDGPWGARHQINFADSGYGLRGPRVYNDRAGEVGRSISAADFDLERLFAAEGCQILHLSGLFAAMSPETGQACLEIARFAKKEGSKISFDLNHRASFWKNRESELRAIFREIASLSDILIGNEEDFQLALGLAGPEAGGSDLSAKISAYREMLSTAETEFPAVEVFATTLREVESANVHHWGAMLKRGADFYVEEPREIPVLDRIGGGDAFVGGLLYGLLREWEPERCLQFGWASGVLATTLLTDYVTPADEEQIWSIYKGNARVRR